MTMPSEHASEPLYVEFAGLPGVGKSTVSREVLALLHARGLRTGAQAAMGHRVVSAAGKTDVGGRHWQRRGRADKLLAYALFHARMWRIALPATALALKRPFAVRDTARRIRRLVLQIQRIRNALDVVRSGQSDVVMFDQGVFLCIREIVTTTGAAGERELGRLVGPVLRSIDARVLLIVLRADVDSIVERLRNRPGMPGPYDRMTSEQARPALARQSLTLDVVVQFVRSCGAVERIVEIEATGSPVASARMIADAILSALGQAQERAASSAAG